MANDATTSAGAQVHAASQMLGERLGGFRPRVLVTLGTLLGDVMEGIDDPIVVGFDELGLPSPTQASHAGRFLAGTLGGVPLLCQQGRLHLYEGYTAQQVSAGVQIAADLGVESFLVTNIAGGVALDVDPGDFVCISDHINFTAQNPLIGLARPHFVDLKHAYDPELRELAHAVGREQGIETKEGVYAGWLGPTFESPAEIGMMRTLGADLVGMSTVMEVIAARSRAVRVLGISLITNVHRPGGTEVDRHDIAQVAAVGAARMTGLVRGILNRM